MIIIRPIGLVKAHVPAFTAVLSCVKGEVPDLKSKTRPFCLPLTLKRKRIMIYFIEATEKLLRSGGLAGLSIRGIAAEAGYNSATIYSYFDSLEQLAMFGSVCYLREYVAQLEQELTPGMRAIDRYRTIYRCFNIHALQNPEIYHHLFFGKYSNMLGDVLRLYYEDLFPGELEHFSDEMRDMLMRGSMAQRDRVVMDRMVSEGDIRPEKSAVTMDLIIALHQNFLYEACLRPDSLDASARRETFRQQFEYLLAAGR